jgi:hypothetical protein
VRRFQASGAKVLEVFNRAERAYRLEGESFQIVTVEVPQWFSPKPLIVG